MSVTGVTVKVTIPNGETNSSPFNSGDARYGVIANGSGGSLTLTLQQAVFSSARDLQDSNRVSDWETARNLADTADELSSVAVGDGGNKPVELNGNAFRLVAGSAVGSDTDVYIHLK